MSFLTDGSRSSATGIEAAVRRLYRSLHLSEPMVVEARNALEFARVCAALAPRTGSRRDLNILGVCLLVPTLLIYGVLLLAVFHVIGLSDRDQNSLDLASLFFGAAVPYWAVVIRTPVGRENH